MLVSTGSGKISTYSLLKRKPRLQRASLIPPPRYTPRMTCADRMILFLNVLLYWMHSDTSFPLLIASLQRSSSHPCTDSGRSWFSCLFNSHYISGNPRSSDMSISRFIQALPAPYFHLCPFCDMFASLPLSLPVANGYSGSSNPIWQGYEFVMIF